MATVIEELVSRLGFDIDDKKLTQFNKKSQQLKNTLKKISVVAGAAAAGITTWVSKIGIATDANIKFADSVGISFEALQELQFAAEREGGSLQSLQSSLLGVSQRAGEASRGMGEGVQVFGLLGVEIKDTNGQLKTADVLLGDIANQFKRFDKTQQIEFANKLGISPDLLLLLQKGRKNLDRLRETVRAYGLVSEETARNAERFQDSFTDIRATVRALFTNIAGDLLPVVSDLADTFREWFLLNRDLIKQNVGKTVKVLVSAIALLVKNAKALLVILSSLVALKVVTLIGSMTLAIGPLIAGIVGINANLTMTNILMGALPLLVGLAIAAIVALVLLVQDLKVFTEGGDSLFGRMAEDSDKARKRIELFAKVFVVIKDNVMFLVDSILSLNGNLWEVIRIVEIFAAAIMNGIGNAIDSVKLKFKSSSDTVLGLIKKINGGISAVINNIKSVISTFTDGIGNAIDSASSKIDNLMNKMKPFKGSLDIRPTIPNVPGPRIGEEFGPQSSTINNVSAEILIQSASGNPESIGQAVANAINDMVRNGTENNPVVVTV